MNHKTILLLGGYGEVGQSVARLLLKETSANIIIAGRRKEKADAFASVLNAEVAGNRVVARFADATQKESLLTAFDGADLVLVLTTTPNSITQIGEAALATGCDYMDILVSQTTVRDLSVLISKIIEQKRVFITQAGFHPGLPAVFVRAAAKYFDQYNSAVIAMAMNARFAQPEQAAEIIPMVADFNAEILRGGAWRKATYKDVVSVDMGKLFGTMKLFPIQMGEIKQLQEKFGLQEAGVYVSGFNWFVDNIVMPMIWITQKIKKGLATKSLLKLFVCGVNKFSSREQGVVFLNEAEGLKDGKKLKVRIVAEHDDAYAFTAIPLVACLKQYLEGILPVGLSMMGQVVDVERLMGDMEKMGVKVTVDLSEKVSDK